MNIPKQIKIGGFAYTVERPKNSFISNEGNALDGEHFFSKKEIKVAKSGCKEYQELVFLHEVCHGIIECYVSPYEQNEKFVEQFSKGLYQVIVDNPGIFGKE